MSKIQFLVGVKEIIKIHFSWCDKRPTTDTPHYHTTNQATTIAPSYFLMQNERHFTFFTFHPTKRPYSFLNYPHIYCYYYTGSKTSDRSIKANRKFSITADVSYYYFNPFASCFHEQTSSSYFHSSIWCHKRHKALHYIVRSLAQWQCLELIRTVCTVRQWVSSHDPMLWLGCNWCWK